MAAHDTNKVDTVTGMSTTGHEWDGIQELNTPLPRWWLWLFYICIVWGIGYVIAYPAWLAMRAVIRSKRIWRR